MGLCYWLEAPIDLTITKQKSIETLPPLAWRERQLLQGVYTKTRAVVSLKGNQLHEFRNQDDGKKKNVGLISDVCTFFDMLLSDCKRKTEGRMLRLQKTEESSYMLVMEPNYGLEKNILIIATFLQNNFLLANIHVCLHQCTELLRGQNSAVIGSIDTCHRDRYVSKIIAPSREKTAAKLHK